MKLLIYLEQSKILNLMKKKYQANPGVGGTTFTAARLAIALKDEIEKFNYPIKIFITTNTNQKCLFHGIEVLPLNEISNTIFNCSIITGDLINEIYYKRILIRSERFISCIRHPFDYDKIFKSKKFKSEIVSVSKGCYISNLFICGPHNQIDNIFDAKRIRDSANSGLLTYKELISTKQAHQILNIGYMGALVSSKGFHYLAENWSNLLKYCKKNNIILRLDVIGGSNLYEFEESHPLLPCSKNYGDLLQKYLGEEINKSVFFHGTLGIERYKLMKNCDLAIVNPTGTGEAFCATILEWHSLGVPVISSLNYGMSDMMKYFKELTINNPKQINKKIIYYLKLDEERKSDLKLKSFLIANYFSSKEKQITQKWLLLIIQSNILINEFKNLKIYIISFKNLIKFFITSFKKFLKSLLSIKLNN